MYSFQVERKSNLDILSLVKGIFRTHEDFSSKFDGPLLVYGYSEHKSKIQIFKNSKLFEPSKYKNDKILTKTTL